MPMMAERSSLPTQDAAHIENCGLCQSILRSLEGSGSLPVGSNLPTVPDSAPA